MEAAVSGDVTLLKQAMLHDPLVGAVCNPEEVWQMTDEMLVAQASGCRSSVDPNAFGAANHPRPLQQ
jgi:alpha-galactosidase/6-phospho-beta-glucosidase family protein